MSRHGKGGRGQAPGGPPDLPGWDAGSPDLPGWDAGSPDLPGWDAGSPDLPGWDAGFPDLPGWDAGSPDLPADHPSGPWPASLPGLPAEPLDPLPDWPSPDRGGYGHGRGYRPRHGAAGRSSQGGEPARYPAAPRLPGQEPRPGWALDQGGYGGEPAPPGYLAGQDIGGGGSAYGTGHQAGTGYGSAFFPGGPDPGPFYPATGNAGTAPPQRGYPDEAFTSEDYPSDAGYHSDPGAPDDWGYPGGEGDPGDESYLDAPGFLGTGAYPDAEDGDAGWAEEAEDGFLPGLPPAPERERSLAGGHHPGRDRGQVGDRGRGRAARAPSRDDGGGQNGRAGRQKGRMRRAAPWIALAVLALILGTAGGGYYYVWRTYLHPPNYSGPGFGSVDVRIYPGDTATAVGERLFKLGVVASARAFANAAKASPQGRSLEPGLYRLRKHMNAALAFELLVSQATRIQVKVTIPEGLRLSSIIYLLGKATGDLKGYQQAIKETSKLGLPSYAHGNPQGYLFPATYTIQPGTPPLAVLQSMVRAFDREAASVSLPSAAAKGNLTPAQVITVASLVEAEGGRLSDYPKIAEVIYNRLNGHIKLQLDSTVLFAVHRYGIVATSAELAVKSPYNTYRHFGLPPGPIDSPGDAAIRAALHPDHGNLLYFVTVNPAQRITKFTSSPVVFARLKAELDRYLATHSKG
jgi:UPF0755 protein